MDSVGDREDGSRNYFKLSELKQQNKREKKEEEEDQGTKMESL